MVYHLKQLGEELRKQLEISYDIKRISRRFYDIYLAGEIEKDELLELIVEYLCMMELGPEYEYNEIELRTIANLLIEQKKVELQEFIKR